MTLQLMDELITIESCSTQRWKRTLKLLIFIQIKVSNKPVRWRCQLLISNVNKFRRQFSKSNNKRYAVFHTLCKCINQFWDFLPKMENGGSKKKLEKH